MIKKSLPVRRGAAAIVPVDRRDEGGQRRERLWPHHDQVTTCSGPVLLPAFFILC